MGYVRWSLCHRNTQDVKKHNNYQLNWNQTNDESDCALFNYHNVENNCVKSLAGFQQRLEIVTL